MSAITKAIQMIAWFDIDGKINPVKFKYEQEEDDTKVISINKILNRDFEKLAGNPMWKLNCSSIIEGIESNYIIKYYLLSNKWLLFMM
ncbi:MAG: hypothetical protein ACRDA5_14845 [Clostridium sp.]